MNLLVAIEGVVILLLLVLVAGLLKSHAEILRRLHRLDPEHEPSTITRPRSMGFGEAPSAEIVGTELGGATRSVSLKNGKNPTLIAFLSSGCATCLTFWDELNGDVEAPLPETRTVIVTKGPQSESPGRLAELAPSGRDLIMSDDAWDGFRVPLTPYFLLLDSEARVIGEGSARNWDHLLGLLRQSTADLPDPTRLGTSDRERFTDSRLKNSGIEPGDPSLYENPLDQ